MLCAIARKKQDVKECFDHANRLEKERREEEKRRREAEKEAERARREAEEEAKRARREAEQERIASEREEAKREAERLEEERQREQRRAEEEAAEARYREERRRQFTEMIKFQNEMAKRERERLAREQDQLERQLNDRIESAQEYEHQSRETALSDVQEEEADFEGIVDDIKDSLLGLDEDETGSDTDLLAGYDLPDESSNAFLDGFLGIDKREGLNPSTMYHSLGEAIWDRLAAVSPWATLSHNVLRNHLANVSQLSDKLSAVLASFSDGNFDSDAVHALEHHIDTFGERTFDPGALVGQLKGSARGLIDNYTSSWPGEADASPIIWEAAVTTRELDRASGVHSVPDLLRWGRSSLTGKQVSADVLTATQGAVQRVLDRTNGHLDKFFGSGEVRQLTGGDVSSLGDQELMYRAYRDGWSAQQVQRAGVKLLVDRHQEDYDGPVRMERARDLLNWHRAKQVGETICSDCPTLAAGMVGSPRIPHWVSAPPFRDIESYESWVRLTGANRDN